MNNESVPEAINVEELKPLQFGAYALYYYSTTLHKEFIILHDTSCTLQAYDIAADAYIILPPPHSNHKFIQFICIDTDRSEIVIFTRFRAIIVLNLDQWFSGDRSTKWHSLINGTGTCCSLSLSSTVYIPSPISQFLFNIKAQWEKWRRKKSKSLNFRSVPSGDMAKFGEDELVDFQLVHCQSRGMVLCFGGRIRDSYSDWDSDHKQRINLNVYALRTKKMKNDRERWKCIKSMKLPNAVKYKKLIHGFLVFDRILVACFGSTMWCLDLSTTTNNKWYKSPKMFKEVIGKDTVMLTTKSGWIMMFDHENGTLKRFLISEILPKKLDECCIEYHHILSFGFIRFEVERKYRIKVPVDLKRCISKYFCPP